MVQRFDDYMSDRHQILADRNFWLRLEYELSGWFRTCGDNALGGYWCDGFMPHSARDTKNGVTVDGIAWIEERKGQKQYAFSLAIPQRLLFRRRRSAVLVVTGIDVQHRQLQLAMAPGTSANTEEQSAV
jgi:hypothetical protein